MHFNHIWIVEAMSMDDAKEKAEDLGNDFVRSNIFDYVGIGGRWDWAEMKGVPVKSNIIKVSKHKEFAEKVIRSKMQTQLNVLKSNEEGLINSMKKAGVTNIFDLNPSESRVGMIGFYLHMTGQVLAGYYCIDSYMYNELTGSSIVTEEDLKDILNSDTTYIINVDGHS